MLRRTTACGLSLLVSVVVAGCTGGGGGGGGGAGSVRPFAIDAAASPALASDVRDLLEVGDRYAFEPDTTLANGLYDQIWARLSAFGSWVDAADNDTFEFFDDTDPLTQFGRAYRFFGFGVFAGPVVPFTAGTYTQANGSAHPALALQTWDGQAAELLVLLADDTFLHAVQNTNGLPIVGTYEGR